MSHPFAGISPFPLGTNEYGAAADTPDNKIETCLRNLAKLPEPRKHYKWYYSTAGANEEMTHPKQGLEAFLRGYFYLKSGAGCETEPEELGGWNAEELAKMPGYYIMPLHKTMSETIEDGLEAQGTDGDLRFMSDEELQVYVDEFSRTGFQGGLNYYRVGTSKELQSDLEVFRGKKIEIPSAFVCGKQDWGYYQTPGAVHEMWSKKVCPDMRGTGHVIMGVGHWTMQEGPREVLGLIHAHLENRIIELAC